MGRERGSMSGGGGSRGGRRRLLAAGSQPPRPLRAQGRFSALPPFPRSPPRGLRSQSGPLRRLDLVRRCPSFASFPQSPLRGSCLQYPRLLSLPRLRPAAAPTSLFCPDAPLPPLLLSLGTGIRATISGSGLLPACAVPQVSARPAVHPSVPPGAGADHAKQLPLSTSRVPVVHPGGTRSACPR